MVARRSDSGQPDLFGVPPAAPSGLATCPDIVSPAEEAALIDAIDAAPLAPFRYQQWEGKRLTASFGWHYDFSTARLGPAAEMPAWLLPLRARAARFAGLEPEALVQALLIRYDPGAAIGWHRDRPVFADVLGVSLGAPAVLRLRRRRADGFARHSEPLPPRSLYWLSGPARHEWEHSIAPQEGVRWSITFRALAGGGARC